MKIVFLSKFYPQRYRGEYLRNSRSGLASAADAHQYALALGFNGVSDDFEIVNLPAIFPFPLRYKKPFVKSTLVKENGLTIKNVGFCNIFLFQQYSKYRRAKKEVENIVKKTDDVVYLVVYSSALYSLKCAIEIRNKYKNVRISLVLPDMPTDMLNKLSLLKSKIGLNRGVFFKSFEEYVKHFDSYVLLTKYMHEEIQCPEDRFIVSEGVYDETASPRNSTHIEPDVFRIFYSGMMYEKFGVINLVKAVSSIKDDDIELVLCGWGDAVNKIYQIAKGDNRIKYLGILSREDVLKQQSESSLLINPRIPDNNPFTRYSFPSKTLEYFASETPTLIFKLDGIPEEYYDYCYTLDSKHTDIDSLANKIVEIKNTQISDRIRLAKKARQFVLEKKNARESAKKIVKLLNTTI